MKREIKIRKAKVTDVKQIQKLINYYANKRVMLPRALNEIYENIRGFIVATRGRSIVACCALGVSWEDLAEVKSLAVMPKYRRKGLGRELVGMCHAEAGKLGIKRVFALTYVPKFFRKLGYSEISRDSLPHKVWSECIRCPFFPDCNEVPLLINLDGNESV